LADSDKCTSLLRYFGGKKVVSATGGDIFWSPSKTEVEIQFFDAEDGILITDHHSSCQTEANTIKLLTAVTDQ